MTLADLSEVLNAIPMFSGKVAYQSFPREASPELPFICYVATASNNFAADNMAFHKQLTVDIELYTRLKDQEAEMALEYALDAIPLFWDKYEEYIESERCFETIYTVTI